MNEYSVLFTKCSNVLKRGELLTEHFVFRAKIRTSRIQFDGFGIQ